MNPDPIAEIVYTTLQAWLQNQIPTGPPYGDLNPKSSGLMLELVRRIKSLNTADRQLEFTSMVSSSTQEPMIRITWGDHEAQIEPFLARQVAGQILDVCHAAEADAFMFSMLVDKVGLSNEQAYAVLNDFRSSRAQMEQMQRERPRKD